MFATDQRVQLTLEVTARWEIVRHAITEAITMNSFVQFRRVAVAFLASIVLNCVLVAIDFSIDPRQPKLSAIQNAVVGLLRPAEALSMRFAPGHGGVQILALVVLSVLVYALVAWVLLSLPIWWRRRA